VYKTDLGNSSDLPLELQSFPRHRTDDVLQLQIALSLADL
jgi:hypothetical protein